MSEQMPEILETLIYIIIGLLTLFTLLPIGFVIYMKIWKFKLMREENLTSKEFDEMLSQVSNKKGF